MSVIQASVQSIVQAVATAIVGDDGGVNPDMVLIMATTGAAETVTIPCQNVGTFNATINWGDGSADSVITAWNDADLAHVYAVAGDQTITISGTFPNIYFNNGGDKLKLKEIRNLGATGLTRLDSAFFGCSNLTSFGGFANTSAVTNMSFMLYNCSSLITLDVGSFNTTAVINMSNMLAYVSSLTIFDLSKFVTPSVTDMGSMLRNTSSATDIHIDGWNIEAVTNFSSFLLNSGIPTSRYDATLIAWDAQNPVDSLSPNFGNSKYTAGGAAEAARTNLVATDLWTITDGGPG